MKLHTREK